MRMQLCRTVPRCTQLPTGYYTMPQNVKIGRFSVRLRQIRSLAVTEYLTNTHDLFKRIVEVWCEA